MRYRVTWHPEAFRNLVRLWKASGSPQNGIAAFDLIETTLSYDAQQVGESRSGNLRILLVSPIGVVFEAYIQILAKSLLLMPG